MVVSGATASPNGFTREGNYAADVPGPIQPQLVSHEELENQVLAAMMDGKDDELISPAVFITRPGQILCRVVQDYRAETGFAPPPTVAVELIAANRFIPEADRPVLRQWLELIAIEIACPNSFSSRHWERNVKAMLAAAERRRVLQDLENVRREIAAGGDLSAVERLVLTEDRVPRGFRLEGMALGRFLRQRSTTRYLVQTEDGRGILAAGQMCLAAGASKSLKTSIVGCDLGLSLATGTKFLNEFPTVQSRVALLSGESGGNAIRSCFHRIAEGRNLEIDEDFDGLIYEQTLPRVSQPGHLRELRRFCIEGKIDVVICDPAYWCLANEATERSAGNLFAMGAQLQLLKNAVPDGVTLILIHHFTKSASRLGRENGLPPQLEDMSQAGFAEHARQWFLLGRRSVYDGESGTHDLWLNVGGSEGHSGLWGVDVREGKQSDMGGRRWSVTVMSKDDVLSGKEMAAETNGEDRRAKKFDRNIEVVRSFMRSRGEPIVIRDLKQVKGLSHEAAKTAFEALKEAREVVETTVSRGNGKDYPAWILATVPDCPPTVPDDLGDGGWTSLSPPPP